MATSGILFAAEEETIKRLRALSESERGEYTRRNIEEIYFDDYPERTANLENYWEAIQRALTGGEFFFDSDGILSKVVLGGELLSSENGYIISAKSPQETGEIFRRLVKLTKKEFKSGYGKIPKEQYPEKSREDCTEAYEYLCDSIPFWRLAAEQGLWVLFTVELS